MGNYTIFGGFENPRRGRQARNLTTNIPKILGLKSSSEQTFSKNCRWVRLLIGRTVPLCLLVVVRWEKGKYFHSKIKRGVLVVPKILF